MTDPRLCERYRGYIDCLNRQDWARLGYYVHDRVAHNGRALGLSGYRDMLVRDFEDIPDLSFTIQLLTCDPPHVAARLMFTCRPRGQFLGLRVDGQEVTFAEHVFYAYEDEKIVAVWSLIDKAAIEAQIRR